TPRREGTGAWRVRSSGVEKCPERSVRKNPRALPRAKSSKIDDQKSNFPPQVVFPGAWVCPVERERASRARPEPVLRIFVSFIARKFKVTTVGIVGWRGMVGSVLLERMIAERDFEHFNPVFFSTSQAGEAGPDVGKGTQALSDAN